ncbi:hypothetical protein NPIL_452791 [Nephila pilipes]|uniref:Uncharacterized protein n=1 Tax=Nephila pilipes TaxID=299642 RepID=A0A8X6NRN0_NEPPI|nr:hypothetical protein NPIL_452791 [Nephila pilipes]
MLQVVIQYHLVTQSHISGIEIGGIACSIHMMLQVMIKYFYVAQVFPLGVETIQVCYIGTTGQVVNHHQVSWAFSSGLEMRGISGAGSLSRPCV